MCHARYNQVQDNYASVEIAASFFADNIYHAVC